MNRLILIFIFISSQVFAQSEFETYENGLIYSETTMNKLETIVDSLNLRYKTCELDKVFYSKEQTTGYIVRLNNGNIKQAKKDIENNISLELFISKYPDVVIEKNVLIVKFKYTNYKDEEIIEFSEINLNSNHGFDISKEYDKKLDEKKVENTWLFEYNEKSKYSDESINAYFFPDNFKSISLSSKYSRQIGYADCLIDTSSTKFKNDAKSGWVELPDNYQNLPLKKKEKLLDEMRSTRVVGGCSMDSRPREHSIHIALLSAETTNWEVFLKSHLDIMNDRFDRVSDGSYAWAQRKTYIKELEKLNIDVLDLLIGISLRIKNPANNHYYGSIGRLGRAISESENKQLFEIQMRYMIEDSELDDYNRIISYFLYISFNSYLEDEKEQKENLKNLEISIQMLPNYLKEKIELKQK
jgi:hypothetical protein